MWITALTDERLTDVLRHRQRDAAVSWETVACETLRVYG
jgi:hypothetical protein